MLFLTAYFITRAEMAKPFLSVRGNATCSSSSVGHWSPASSSGTHLYICTLCMVSCICLFDTDIDRRLLKSVKLKELTETHWICLTLLEEPQRPICLERTNKDCFPLCSSTSGEYLIVFQNMRSQARPRQSSQWAALIWFLTQTYWKHRRTVNWVGGLGFGLWAWNQAGCSHGTLRSALSSRMSLWRPKGRQVWRP